MTRRRPARAADAAARRRTLRRTAAAALLIPALVGGFALQAWGGNDGERMFHEVVAAVADRGLDSLTDAQLYENAARGLLARLGDPYAELFSPEQLARFSRETMHNAYGGLGMQISVVRDTALVTRVFTGGPAARGGVRAGDRIVAADGQDVTGLPVDQVTARLLGTPGTSVAVDFARPGQGGMHHEFVRERVTYPSVSYASMLDGDVGYVPLEGFSDTSAEEVRRALADLRKRGARAYVLDLRGNTGGALDQAVRIAGFFLDQGQEILRAEFRNAPQERYHALEGGMVAGAPLVVMVDGESASASEIVAGALQDHDRAVIVGTTSFGKGLVQDVFRLDGGWALKLTTGRWYTPSGRTIQRPRTLTPDGRFVTLPDSAERPVFRSDAGRPVLGGGGVTPDLAVRQDTLRGAELALMRLLAPRGGVVNAVLMEVAADQQFRVAPDFRATPAWRQDLHRRLRDRGVTVDRAAWDAGAPLLDRLLEDRVSELAFGDSASFRRAAPRDAQLQAALGILRDARTQPEALARAGAAVPAQAGT